MTLFFFGGGSERTFLQANIMMKECCIIVDAALVLTGEKELSQQRHPNASVNPAVR
jgi:hypothetical protein